MVQSDSQPGSVNAHRALRTAVQDLIEAIDLALGCPRCVGPCRQKKQRPSKLPGQPGVWCKVWGEWCPFATKNWLLRDEGALEGQDG